MCEHRDAMIKAVDLALYRNRKGTWVWCQSADKQVLEELITEIIAKLAE